MAKSKAANRAGWGRLLDAWSPPEGAGSAVGCLATTFTFSSEFFEEECLGRFLQFDTEPVDSEFEYLIEREEKLSQLACASVLVDQHHCRGPRSPRWDLLPARLRGGVMHAKVTLLYWSEWIRVVIGSANLTAEAYRHNQEIFGVLDFRRGGHTPLECLRPITAFLREIVGLARPKALGESPAVGRWQSLLDRVDEVTSSWDLPKRWPTKSEVRAYPILLAGDRPDLMSAMRKRWPAGSAPLHAAVVSPFFDKAEGINEPAKALAASLGRTGAPNVQFYVHAEQIPGEQGFYVQAPKTLWATASDRVDTQLFRVELEEGRTLHAKALWLENSKHVLYMVGSSNFTSAGFGLSSNVRNVEANLAYTFERKNYSRTYGTFERCFPSGVEIDLSCPIRWQSADDAGTDAPSDEAPLPESFGDAIFRLDENDNPRVVFQIAESAPNGWRILEPTSVEEVVAEAAPWVASGRPNFWIVPWSGTKTPTGFWVMWDGAPSKAWWPVNVGSASDLPPIEELKQLSLDALLRVLTSALPLHRVLAQLSRQNAYRGAGGGAEDVMIAELDPHKRVNTSGFMLQRTRRVSWALAALRERLERPVPTIECLRWRLFGPVGARALAEALVREGHSPDEKAFLLSELALELKRVQPTEAIGCLEPHEILREIDRLISDLRSEINRVEGERSPGLDRYVGEVFGALAT